MRIDTAMFPLRIDVCQYDLAMSTLLAASPGSALTPLPVRECAPLLSGAPLDDQAAAQLAAVLRVLADPGRLRILSLIQAQPTREACVCHLTDALGLAQPTVSHHLRVLFGAGLLGRERRGNWVYYRAVPGALDGLRDALTGDATPAATVTSGDCSTGCACR
jgi:ArsR family transcriptional regulator, arsenate/arsenite/antimonite-responsive transcriptional repressor